MKATVDDGQMTVELTRRNLLTLLAKLDGHPENSSCCIAKDGVTVKAVEDAEHYTDRPYGRAHEATEAAIKGNK